MVSRLYRHQVWIIPDYIINKALAPFKINIEIWTYSIVRYIKNRQVIYPMMTNIPVIFHDPASQ